MKDVVKEKVKMDAVGKRVGVAVEEVVERVVVAVEEVVERVVVEGGASESCRSRAVCADCSSVLRCCG